MEAAATGNIQGVALLILALIFQRLSAGLNLISKNAAPWRSKNILDISKIAKAGREGLIECNHIVPLV